MKAFKIIASILWGVMLAIGLHIANPNLPMVSWPWIEAAAIIIFGAMLNAVAQAIK